MSKTLSLDPCRLVPVSSTMTIRLSILTTIGMRDSTEGDVFNGIFKLCHLNLAIGSVYLLGMGHLKSHKIYSHSVSQDAMNLL